MNNHQAAFYDFESDLMYQMQLHEALKTRSMIAYNQKNTDIYFKQQLEDFVVTNVEKHSLLSLLDPEQMNYSVKQFLALYRMTKDWLDSREEPTVNRYIDHMEYIPTIRNLKQRITNLVKDRNSHFQLSEQVAIMDAVNSRLEMDVFQVLAAVGYHAILIEDEHNIPKSAKNYDKEAEIKAEKKRQKMAEEFALMDISADVIRSCDKYIEDGKRNNYFCRFFKE